MSFAGTNYTVGAKYRRQQVQIAVVGNTVEICVDPMGTTLHVSGFRVDRHPHR